MTWQQWFLISWQALSVAAMIYMVDKEREPVTAGTAVAAFAVGIGIVWVVLSI